MPKLTVTVDGQQVFSRDVDRYECEETAGGTYNLHADFPPIDVTGPPTGTQLSADSISALEASIFIDEGVLNNNFHACEFRR